MFYDYVRAQCMFFGLYIYIYEERNDLLLRKRITKIHDHRKLYKAFRSYGRHSFQKIAQNRAKRFLFNRPKTHVRWLTCTIPRFSISPFIAHINHYFCHSLPIAVRSTIPQRRSPMATDITTIPLKELESDMVDSQNDIFGVSARFIVA
jgi:hypothetical protein